MGTTEKEFEFFRSGAEIYSVCLKLQSFGLVMAVERIATTLGLQSAPYTLLPRGIQFLCSQMFSRAHD
jgi:hypothetical protein